LHDRPSLVGVRVVVADDDADTRELLAVVLRGYGADVRAVGSAAEARDAVRTMPADVLVSDISMPDEDGYSLVRSLRERMGASAKIPAIALTALARPEDHARALEAGFQRYVTKPLDPDELASVVCALVAEAAMSSSLGTS